MQLGGCVLENRGLLFALPVLGFTLKGSIMLIVEIKTTVIDEISGTSKAGKPYHIRKQSAYAYTFDKSGVANPFPDRFELSLKEGQSAYPLGRYTIAPRSFYVGDFYSLALIVSLDPVPARSS